MPTAATAVLIGALGCGLAVPAHAVLTGAPEPSSDQENSAAAAVGPARFSPGVIPADPRHYAAFQITLTGQVPERAEGDLRVGSFQAGLTRAEPGELLEELTEPGSEQAQQVAEAVQQVRPDVLLLSGIDVDEGLQVAAALRTNYLTQGTRHTAGIDYPHVYVAPVNAGVDTGADLDDDGMIGGPGDSFGYGEFPGQAGMMILSRVPLETDQARTFQDFKWQDMPGSALPTEQFTELEASVLRLSSTSHWDVPVSVGGRTVHLLASAPADPQTAPAGAERNHDEVRFWADYIAGAGYPVDDDGHAGGLEASSDFVVLGSLGADPATDTGADPATMGHLTDLPHVQDTHPTSSGALLSQTPEDTAVVQDAQGEPTTARLDYVLPSSTLTASNSGVFWPAAGQPGHSAATDHRLVWVDITPDL